MPGGLGDLGLRQALQRRLQRLRRRGRRDRLRRSASVARVVGWGPRRAAACSRCAAWIPAISGLRAPSRFRQGPSRTAAARPASSLLGLGSRRGAGEGRCGGRGATGLGWNPFGTVSGSAELRGASIRGSSTLQPAVRPAAARLAERPSQRNRAPARSRGHGALAVCAEPRAERTSRAWKNNGTRAGAPVRARHCVRRLPKDNRGTQLNRGKDMRDSEIASVADARPQPVRAGAGDRGGGSGRQAPAAAGGGGRRRTGGSRAAARRHRRREQGHLHRPRRFGGGGQRPVHPRSVTRAASAGRWSDRGTGDATAGGWLRSRSSAGSSWWGGCPTPRTRRWFSTSTAPSDGCRIAEIGKALVQVEFNRAETGGEKRGLDGHRHLGAPLDGAGEGSALRAVGQGHRGGAAHRVREDRRRRRGCPSGAEPQVRARRGAGAGARRRRESARRARRDAGGFRPGGRLDRAAGDHAAAAGRRGRAEVRSLLRDRGRHRLRRRPAGARLPYGAGRSGQDRGDHAAGRTGARRALRPRHPHQGVRGRGAQGTARDRR